jgi:hypothetical protein|tara:strand:- start:25 stop:3465 length:3441 start_codon:yes stop_codon:yes gene_type:complete
MQVSQEKYARYLELQKEAIEGKVIKDERIGGLKWNALKDNPNVTYGNLLSPQELKVLANFTPTVLPILDQIYSAEEIADIRKKSESIGKNRIALYNRAPIDFDVEERFPEYTRRIESYDEREILSPIQRGMLAGTAGMPAEYLPPVAPVGLEKAKKIAARGFEPDNELKFENFKEGAAFRTKVGFAPRHMTKEDWDYLGKQHGLEGEYIYIDPSNPSLGVAFKAEGEEDYKLVNTPYLTAEDTYKFIVNEVPAIAADIALMVSGGKRFGVAAGLTGNVWQRGKSILKLSGLGAAGATGGDFLRLSIGRRIGAHDRGMMSVLKESGMIGALSFAGTSAISIATNLLPKLWRMAAGTDVPAEFLDDMKRLYDKAAETERGIPVLSSDLYGDEITMKEIYENLDDLANRFKVDLSKYNPTLASKTGSVEAADLETLFLKYADDKELAKAYQLIKMGNQEVIDAFVRILGEKIGPRVGADITAAEVGVGLRGAIQKDIGVIEKEARDMINNVRNNLLKAEDIALPGQTLLKEVPDEKISTPLFQRTQKRLKEIKDNYLGGYRTTFLESLKNPRYDDLTTGAGFTRTPTNKWIKVRKGESASLFKELEADEAADMLYGATNKETLNRLRGMNSKSKQFANGEEIAFTLQELNATREVLNDFASQTDNLVAKRYARDLERGLENQMFKLLQEGAARQSGLEGVALKRYMKETGYGDEIRTAWKEQADAIKTANTEAMHSIIQLRPEKVADYILGTSVPYSKVNTPIADLMTVLKTEGSGEILDIQKGMAEYVRRTIFDAPGQTPFLVAKAYREFMKKHRGTLETIFGKDGFKQTFSYSPKLFQKEVIDKIAEREAIISEIQNKFGISKTGIVTDISAGNKLTNIVESILARGKTEKAGGEILADIKYLTTLTKNDPVLKTQIAQVTKNYLFKNYLQPRQGLGGMHALDGAALERLLYGEFGAEAIVGKKLTFDNFIIPLLGKDSAARDFVKNLKYLNEMVQREIGPAPSKAVQIKTGTEYGVGSPIEGSRIAQRLLIPPLTQFGRRVTALANRTNARAKRFLGRMFLEEELFNKTMFWARGRMTTQQFIRFLYSYDSVESRDLANEIVFYDTEEKVQTTPEQPILEKMLKEPQVEKAKGVYDRVLNAIGATP